jgi:hypothetical protein
MQSYKVFLEWHNFLTFLLSACWLEPLRSSAKKQEARTVAKTSHTPNTDAHFSKEINYLQDITTVNAQHVSFLLLKKLQHSREDCVTLLKSSTDITALQMVCFSTYSVWALFEYILFSSFPLNKSYWEFKSGNLASHYLSLICLSSNTLN